MVDREDNLLAVYLAEYGASHWKEMVIIEEPFGRVEELWHYDMGLGYFGPRFRAALQGEVNPAVVADEVVDPPNANLNQGNDNEGPMEVAGEQNGMELLAEAAGMNAKTQLGDGNQEHNAHHEVVIGLAAVPVDDADMNLQ